ncbi:flagellar M-ring protein FliF [Candidatus Poribacteria bacterium]|nr:flagellar M-ring protein FliF [Candidatus Poribacteria bacterium]
MPEGIKGLLEQLKTVWGNLPRQAKIVIPLVSIGLLIGLIALSLRTNSSYTLLYSNLNVEDLRDIQIELSRMNVKYKLGQDNSIYVPSKEEARLRLMLSESGLPRGDNGYSIFKERNLGETFFDYERKYQEATERKLKQAIESLRPVKFATVNITPMEESVFLEGERPAKASVMLQLEPGTHLSRKQVEGIVHLVAGAVKGLDPENVVILDERGNQLNADLDEVESAQMRLKHQSELEKLFARKIRDLLVPLVGPNGFSAEVTVETNFDLTETTTKKYNNDDEVISKETTTTENSQGVVSTGLPPGTASNVVSSAQVQLPSSNQPISLSRNTTTKEYVPSETIQKVKSLPGDIKKVSVSVLLDYKRSVGPNGKVTKVPWTTQELQMIEDNIKSAIGYDQRRGDMVKVNAIQFDTLYALQYQAELKSAKRHELYMTFARYLSIVALGFMLFILVRFIIKTLASPQGKVIPAALGPEVGPEAIETGEGRRELETKREVKAVEAQKEEELSLEEIFPELTGESRTKAEEIQRKVFSFAEHDPEAMAKLIRTWLLEDEKGE